MTLSSSYSGLFSGVGVEQPVRNRADIANTGNSLFMGSV